MTMAVNAPRLHLICYDIADPRRLGRVYRYLSTRATPLQYSVFVARLSRRAVEEIAREVDSLIEPSEDDVRLYPLPHTLHVIGLGRSILPEGASLLVPGHDLLDLHNAA